MAASTTADQQYDTAASDRAGEAIDVALDRYTQFDGDCPSPLAEAIRYAVLGPGKRLRPRLVLLAAEVSGSCVDAAMPAACAVELVHAYSLVHDDLPAMDDDDLRRGRPTCHKAFGEAVAILVGDALLARAFEILATDISPADRAAACCAALGRAAGPSDLVGGQAADLAGDLPMDDVAALEAVHRRKTGALIAASLQLGGIVAAANRHQLAALGEFGQRLGLAFQITDDLLDAAGDSAVVGKRVAKDADRGKATYPQVLGVDRSRQRAAELVAAACAAVEDVFGTRARPLCGLAGQILDRDR